MATGQTSTVTTESSSFAQWTSWLAALVGLWVVVSPFALTGSIASGTPMWSNVVAGLAVFVLAVFGAYTIRTTAETGTNTTGEWSGWLAALVGLWVAVSPFALTGSIASGTPMWSNLAAGLVAFVLAAYNGYAIYAGE